MKARVGYNNKIQQCKRTLIRAERQMLTEIPKIRPGAYFFQRPFLRGLSMEGNLRLKIDWASVVVGRKFTGFALFYFVFGSNFQVQATGGAYIWRGDLTEGFFPLRVWGAYFRNFTVSHFISTKREGAENKTLFVLYFLNFPFLVEFL